MIIKFLSGQVVFKIVIYFAAYQLKVLDSLLAA